jgi:hypothetical protein
LAPSTDEIAYFKSKGEQNMVDTYSVHKQGIGKVYQTHSFMVARGCFVSTIIDTKFKCSVVLKKNKTNIKEYWASVDAARQLMIHDNPCPVCGNTFDQQMESQCQNCGEVSMG